MWPFERKIFSNTFIWDYILILILVAFGLNSPDYRNTNWRCWSAWHGNIKINRRNRFNRLKTKRCGIHGNGEHDPCPKVKKRWRATHGAWIAQCGMVMCRYERRQGSAFLLGGGDGSKCGWPFSVFQGKGGMSLSWRWCCNANLLLPN